MKAILKYILFAVFTIGIFSACTNGFEDINTNPHEATAEMLETDNLSTGSFFSQMIIRMVPFTAGGEQDDSYGSTGSYQHFQGLCSDWYSGYVAPTGTWANGNHNGNYYFTGTWGNSMYSQNFTQIMPAWAQIVAKAEENNQPQVAALATVVKVYAMHRVTDQYGPIPYVNYVAGSLTNTFDRQEDIYNKFFNELDSAIDVLTPYASAGSKIMEDFDYIYQGDAENWVRFANTLRLRLALRVVYVNETLAKTEAEKSFNNSIGFLDDATQRATISGVSILNPIYEQAYSWNEERMGASMDSYLNGYNDPRLAVYFNVAAGDNKYHGVRLGINMANGNSAYTGDAISNFNITATTTIPYMSAAESYFLRAEAALRGWDAGGTAKDFYEDGIRVSMAEQGVTSGIDAYISDDTSKPADFVDNTNNGGNADAKSTITIAWDDDADFETNFERIITQKWIANFLISPEGWTEFRRTGYPKLFPVTRNSSSSTIDTELQIRRMPYPSTLYTTDPEGVAGGVELLGGDNGGIKLWWDKNPNH